MDHDIFLIQTDIAVPSFAPNKILTSDSLRRIIKASNDSSRKDEKFSRLLSNGNLVKIFAIMERPNDITAWLQH